jgi:hypothetical protein
MSASAEAQRGARRRRARLSRRATAVSKATALVAAGVLGAGTLLASMGAIDVYDPSGRLRAGDQETAPAWSDPCRRHAPRPDRVLLHSCARVHGRVLAAKRTSDSDGTPEIHLAVLSEFHVFLVKLAVAAPTPSVGSTITVVGPLVRARNGMREIQAWRMT